MQTRVTTRRSLFRGAVITVLLLSPWLNIRAQAEVRYLAIAGSTTVQPIAARMARGFMKDHSRVRVSVAGGGSTVGLQALVSDAVDIASSSRFISEQEIAAALGAGVFPVPFHIADDCIIPVVHKSNKLRSLSLDDLRRIYLGQVRNWRELGGADKAITVISRETGSGTFGTWQDVVMRGLAVAPGVISKTSSAQVLQAVSRSKEAIGYVSLGHLSASIKPLRVNDVMGSVYTARNGSYALSRHLFLFTRGWPSAATQAFIHYALDPDQGQLLVRKSGFIPVHKHSPH